LWISFFQAIDELISFIQKSEFGVLDLGFDTLGLGLDNRGRTTENAYRHIYYGRTELHHLALPCLVFHERGSPNTKKT
jgi:hypothetical protein